MSEGSGTDSNGGVLRYRVESQGKRLDRIEDWRTKVDEDRTTVKAELRQIHLDVSSNTAEVRGMRRVMIGLLATIATSTFVGALTVLLATGKL